MDFTHYHLSTLYDRTSGYCHICGKKLAYHNHGRFGARGAWEVEHSNPRAKGGTDRLSNLFPACIECNGLKGTMTTRAVRAWYGRKRAPLSREKREEARKKNALLGMILGGVFGSIWGPMTLLVGVAVGGHLGSKRNPDQH